MAAEQNTIDAQVAASTDENMIREVGSSAQAVEQGTVLAVEAADESKAKAEVEKEEENAIRPVEVAGQAAIGQGDAIRPVRAPAGASQEQSSDVAAAQPVLSTLLRGRFVRDEAGIYRRQGETREALADEGAQIRFVDKQTDTFEAGVELAKAKGWKAIEVTGTEKFRAEAWFHAKAAGLDVVGYEPNEADLKRLAAHSRGESGKGVDAPAAPMTSEQSARHEALMQSKAAAERYAFNADLGVQGVSVERGRYAGKVLHETEHHVVQDIGRGTVVIHKRDDLDANYKEMLKSSKKLRINYHEGKGRVEAAEKSRGLGMGR